MKPPLKPCGTRAAYMRGCRCEPCTKAKRAYNTQQDRARGIKPRVPYDPEETVSEIEFLVNCGEGEHAILKAINLTPRSIQQLLYKAGRSDLSRRIFNHDQQMVWAA